MTRSVVLAFAVAGLFLPACASESVEEAVLRPVRTTRVQDANAAAARTFPGVSQAEDTTSLSFPVSGTVTNVEVKAGDVVKVGQFLARIDTTDYELSLREAQAGLAQAKAQLAQAEGDYSRLLSLYESGNASSSQLDAARTGEQAARASVGSAGQRVSQARRRVEQCLLTSAVEGSVAQVLVQTGEAAAAGKPVVVISSGDAIEVVIAVPERMIARIVSGQPASIEFESQPGAMNEGVVTEVGVAPTGSATTFPVVVRLNGATAELRPGMAAEVRLVLGTDQERSIRVPAAAVLEDPNGHFVYVFQAPEGEELTEGMVGTVARRAVVVGPLSREGIEIREGLNNGDLLVTAGWSQITDGLEVRLLVDKG